MRHFSFLPDSVLAEIFHRVPETMGPSSDPALLAVALGGTLYSPGTRTTLADDVLRAGSRGCFSQVLCLEDSIPDKELGMAEENVLEALRTLNAIHGHQPDSNLPMLFVRVRNPDQMVSLARRGGDALNVLTGFTVPKFENDTGLGQRYFDALAEIHRFREADDATKDVTRFKLMPILESPSIIHVETRTETLTRVVEVIKKHREDVLAVRIGATDFSSVFGLRRPRELTIYDVQVVASVISDIVNVLGRPEDGLIITGPVWEHFSQDVSTSSDHHSGNLASLSREIRLDHANGLLGKTVIHPTHVPLVNALSVVSHEEFMDASDIVDADHDGAMASSYSNKMNEIKPHRAWAERTLLRAAAFGVAAPGTTFIDLLEASPR